MILTSSTDLDIDVSENLKKKLKNSCQWFILSEPLLPTSTTPLSRLSMDVFTIHLCSQRFVKVSKTESHWYAKPTHVQWLLSFDSIRTTIPALSFPSRIDDALFVASTTLRLKFAGLSSSFQTLIQHVWSLKKKITCHCNPKVPTSALDHTCCCNAFNAVVHLLAEITQISPAVSPWFPKKHNNKTQNCTKLQI